MGNMKEQSQRKYLHYAALEKYMHWSKSHCREILRNDRKDEELQEGERQCKVSLMWGESGNFLRTQVNP